MPKIKVKGQAVQAGELGQADTQTDATNYIISLASRSIITIRSVVEKHPVQEKTTLWVHLQDPNIAFDLMTFDLTSKVDIDPTLTSMTFDLTWNAEKVP